MRYIVNDNPQSNRDHEVHKYPRTYCSSPNYPDSSNQVDLGLHINCHSAVRKAKSLGYEEADGCYYCSRPCHKS